MKINGYDVEDGIVKAVFITDLKRDLKMARFEMERPRGEWEHWGSPFSDDSIANSIVCSLCKARYVEIEDEVFNFCPNCGARMEKEGAEE